ncbi:AI-2E family transporter [Algoriphagus machipongonensis]|uniref:Transport protein n=1 Tax=Algoriphagus machipongonensis TaxID=388413 RepID=A3HYR7_9BACT|nr:AI-2E family transporter [Algoriphagus machipongonensis]EAZ80403.1 putative transport protein [Algoriphagus machipongonensis]
MKSKEILIILTLIVVGTYFSIVGLIEAGGFLKPLAIAVLLTLICIPLCRKLESLNFSKGLSAFVSVLLSLLAFLSFFVIISAQVANVSERWPEIKSKAKPKLEGFQQKVTEKTGLNLEQQLGMFGFSGQDSGAKPNEESEKRLDSNQSTDKANSDSQPSPEKIVSNASQEVGVIVMNFFSFLSSSVLTLVYLFFLLLYRNKVKLSILKFFSEENQKEAEEVMSHTVELGLNFIVGRFILIVFLAIIYSIGLSISGIENAILISVIAAVLSLVPFIGNIIGYVLAIIMAVFAGAELGGIIGVSLTFGLAQFVESYILEPYVVGSKVEVNPLVTIMVVILGGAIWGIIGMILSIPIAGIAKIIFDATPALKPMGYALGEEDVEGADEQNFLSKWGEKLWVKFSKK